MSSNFRVSFPVTSFSERISYENKIFSIGSCFSQNMAEKLQHYKFSVFTNPFGITYNPLSIAIGLERILNKNFYSEEELFYHNELWNSFDHHSDFSAAEKEVVLKNINEHLEKSYEFLLNAKTIIITFGTAYYYKLNEKQQVVNNCHKIAEKQFSHLLYSSNEIVERFAAVIEKMKVLNASANFIFTVSPVRHRNLSAEKNTFSKAHLIIACHELCGKYQNANYFPAYELMIDDLRDYRFYKADMMHPNELAVDYIFEKFTEACIEKKSIALMQQILQSKNNLSHRPRNAGSEAHQKFLKQQLSVIESLCAKYSFFNFEEEIKQLNIQLLNGG